MYAVIKTGGKQYRVMQGEVLRVEKLEADVGAAINFDQVLLLGEGEGITMGSPLVAGASVAAVRHRDRGREQPGQHEQEHRGPGQHRVLPRLGQRANERHGGSENRPRSGRSRAAEERLRPIAVAETLEPGRPQQHEYRDRGGAAGRGAGSPSRRRFRRCACIRPSAPARR